MITYVIEPQIVPLVRAGRVVQLLRSAPVRCATRGSRIGLIDAGSREVIPDPVVTAVHGVDITWDGCDIVRMRQGGIPVLRLDRLAQACGYDCVEDLAARILKSAGGPVQSAFIVEWIAPEAMMAEVG